MSGLNCANQTVFLGDNLDIMRGLNRGIADAIITDSPFNSNRRHNHLFGTRPKYKSGKDKPGFDDAWTLHAERGEEYELLAAECPDLYHVCVMGGKMHSPGMRAYLIMMATRLLQCHRLLKETGSIYLHCDHSANAYLRLLMDGIFGQKNFRNEIVWQRSFVKGTRGPRRSLGTITDTILFYAKSEKTKIIIPKTTSQVLPKFKHKDERGYYRAVTQLMADSQLHDSPRYEWNGLDPKYGWRVSKENLERLHKKGLIHYNSSGRPYRKQYAVEYEGMDVGNLWNDIPPASPSERSGWATQKPLALYSRMILASSNPGDVVLDPFCGCATTLVAAENAGRQWIGIDRAPEAEEQVKIQLGKLNENSYDFWRDQVIIRKCDNNLKNYQLRNQSVWANRMEK